MTCTEVQQAFCDAMLSCEHTSFSMPAEVASPCNDYMVLHGTQHHNKPLALTSSG